MVHVLASCRIMLTIQDILARNLRQARTRVGISQEELADRAGIDRTYVSGIERGRRNPTIGIVARLAAELDVTAAALLEQ